MTKYKKPRRTKKQEDALIKFFSEWGDKRKFIKEHGMSPGYMYSMYKPYKKKSRKKET